MKIKYHIVVTLLLLFQLLPLISWSGCKSFLYKLYFSSYDLELQLIDLIHKDSGLPLLITRLFHNKAIQFVLDIYKRYTQFIDIGFFISLITFVGLFGMFCGIWYFFSSKKKDRRIGIVFIFGVLLPLIEILVRPNLPFLMKVILIGAPFHVIALYGHYHFIKQIPLRVVLVTYFILISLSVAWMLFPPLIDYCVTLMS